MAVRSLRARIVIFFVVLLVFVLGVAAVLVEAGPSSTAGLVNSTYWRNRSGSERMRSMSLAPQSEVWTWTLSFTRCWRARVGFFL